MIKIISKLKRDLCVTEICGVNLFLQLKTEVKKQPRCLIFS